MHLNVYTKDWKYATKSDLLVFTLHNSVIWLFQWDSIYI